MAEPVMSHVAIITGLSGAGKGLAQSHFEDFGFYCVDNLISDLIFSA